MTKMEKVFQRFCHKSGHAVKDLRFMFDGHRLNGAQTPEQVRAWPACSRQSRLGCLPMVADFVFLCRPAAVDNGGRRHD